MHRSCHNCMRRRSSAHATKQTCGETTCVCALALHATRKLAEGYSRKLQPRHAQAEKRSIEELNTAPPQELGRPTDLTNTRKPMRTEGTLVIQAQRLHTVASSTLLELRDKIRRSLREKGPSSERGVSFDCKVSHDTGILKRHRLFGWACPFHI